MLIERTDGEIIIRLPSYVNTDGVQRLINYLSYKEASAKTKATQADADRLAKEVKKGWWDKNKRRILKDNQ
jgi:hypothetical protein